MEKYFGNAYRGDPGVPHTDPDRFWNIWIGSAAFSALTWFNPYMWQLSNQFNWHDKAMLYEQHHWKKAMAKKQPYKFKWNEYMDKEAREAYYFNWPWKEAYADHPQPKQIPSLTVVIVEVVCQLIALVCLFM